jgi:glycopeptide antibiotics resistance protein
MFIRHNILAILWALLILVLTLVPGDEFPDLSFWSLLTFDKAAHAFVFGVLVLLFMTGFSKQYTFPAIRYSSQKAALLVGVTYAVITEVLQYLLAGSRTADLMDIMANLIGCLIGFGIFRVLYGSRGAAK